MHDAARKIYEKMGVIPWTSVTAGVTPSLTRPSAGLAMPWGTPRPNIHIYTNGRQYNSVSRTNGPM